MYPAGPEILELEIELLLEAIYRTYRSDFRHYGRACMRRRLLRALLLMEVPTLSDLQVKILHDPASYDRLLHILTVPTTEMFRDPPFFLTVREKVLPHLETYPSLKVWLAGCSTGEEAYSMAILLHEADLLKRSQIYATDINAIHLKTADAGVYPLESIRRYARNYQLAGGSACLEDYYQTRYGRAKFASVLRDKIVFADHSLATDSVFAEMELILCRNTLIYFDQYLQDRAFGLFYEALGHRGFLGLGSRETLQFSKFALGYEDCAVEHKIYRKKNIFPEAREALAPVAPVKTFTLEKPLA